MPPKGIAKGAFGLRNGRGRLSWAAVQLVRASKKTPGATMARALGVSEGAISRIRGDERRQVQGPPDPPTEKIALTPDAEAWIATTADRISATQFVRVFDVTLAEVQGLRSLRGLCLEGLLL